MFSKTLTALTFLCALTLQVNAHSGITPALGVSGTFARGNVQRPSTASPCGNINVAQNIDTSTPVVAAANGQFTATVTNFNAYVSFTVFQDETDMRRILGGRMARVKLLLLLMQLVLGKPSPGRSQSRRTVIQ
jgi:hypothetical protein